MISKKQRKEFKKAVGNAYTARVMAVLEEKNILSKEGKPYAGCTIRHVLNGKFNNPAIEEALFEVCQQAKKEHVKERVF